jgi:hypothetical protein
MGDRDDRPAAQRARTGSASGDEPGGSGPGAATQPPAGPGLADALHGAPDLLAAARPLDSLRRTSKECCKVVDGAATRCRLGFASARRAERHLAQSGSLLQRMARRLSKLPRLGELVCLGPSGAELEQLLAMAAAAQPSSVGAALGGVQRLRVEGTSTAPLDEPGSGLPALLRSLAHLPSLQVCYGLA